MKVLLVSIPLEFPLATYCLAAQLSVLPDTQDVEVELLNLDAERLNDYRRKNSEMWRYVARVEEMRPDIVAFSVYLWSHLAIRELVELTARIYPGVHIVIGGPELASTDAADPWMQRGLVAAVVRGEGEITFPEIVRRLRGGDSLAGVQGCSWWTGRAVTHEPPRPPIADLSALASPYLTGLIPDTLFDRPGHSGQFPRAFIETYRGCYMQCSYCQWGNGSRSRFEFQRDRVQQELSWIISRHVSRVWIVDAMFGYKKQVAKDLLRHIIDEKRRHGAETSIVCYHNQDFFDHELFDLYHEANVSVEVDLQSTDKAVLTRVGRAKWYIDSFDRHRDAFRAHGVPTTGAADLIIGLPKDTYGGLRESVDFMLRRGMRVNLYQTSIIPATPMWNTVEEDGMVFSPVAPRAVFKNATFPVRDMVKARLLGHGVDFFSRYPRTASFLWQLGFDSPVSLCERLGGLLWERYGVMYGDTHTHDGVLFKNEAQLEDVLNQVCIEGWQQPIVRDLFRLEAAIGMRLGVREGGPQSVVRRAPVPAFSGSSWLDWRPRYRRDAITEVRLEHRLDRLLSEWHRTGEMPDIAAWQRVERSPRMALVYASAHNAVAYQLVDPELTFELLQRMSGYFTLADCLDSLGGSGWRQKDLSPLLSRLADFAAIGIIDAFEGATTRRPLTPLAEHDGLARIAAMNAPALPM
jgi:radical SAM superfamily enzyme YgiQ (UPF0313 family)